MSSREEGGVEGVERAVEGAEPRPTEGGEAAGAKDDVVSLPPSEVPPSPLNEEGYEDEHEDEVRDSWPAPPVSAHRSASANPPAPLAPQMEEYEALPPFASEENLKLHARVREKERTVERLTAQMHEHQERVRVMRDHLKNVEAEIAHTEQVNEAKRGEIKTEEHLAIMARSEAERLRSDSSKLQRQAAEAQERLNALRNEVFANQEKYEEFQRQMQWNQQELLQWSLAAKQKDEDQEAVERYKKQDNAKIRQLTLVLERLNVAVAERKKELESELAETQSVQVELDRTAEEYRRVHEERQAMIARWDESKRQLQRRDATIAEAGERIVELRERVSGLEGQVEEGKEFLEREQKSNHAVGAQIEQAERAAERLRKELHKSSEGLASFQDEVYALRNELTNANQELTKTRNAAQELVDERETKEAEFEQLERDVEEARARLEEELAHTGTLEEQSKQVDALHSRHERELADTEKEVQRMKELMFKESHALFDLRKSEANLIAMISSSQGTARNLQGRIYDLDQRSLKQQEMLYNIEFQVQQLERKVSFAGGKRSVEETLELNRRIAALKQRLEESTASHQMLNGQVKRLDENLRKTRRRHARIEDSIREIQAFIERVQLENESAEAELAAAEKQRDEKVVRHDLLKLEVKKLGEQLDASSEAVLGLENRKLQLQLSITQREQEIAAQHATDRAELKMAEQARSQLAKDQQERRLRVEKLQQKFETIAARLGTPGGGDEGGQGGGAEHSQAYYIIAAAQEREELQRRGDELNEAILRGEKEIRMLDKTLQHLSGRNRAFRESFHRADMASDDAELKRQLDDQHRAVSDDLFRKRSYLREIATDHGERTSILQQLRRNTANLREEARQMVADRDRLGREMRQTEQAAARAYKQLREAQQDYRAKAGVSAESSTREEVNMDAQERRSRVSTLLAYLGDFASQHPEVHADVMGALDEAGIDARPSTAGSARSAASSVASAASSSRVRSPPPRRALDLGAALVAAPLSAGSASPGSSRASTPRSTASSSGGRTGRRVTSSRRSSVSSSASARSSASRKQKGKKGEQPDLGVVGTSRKH